MKSTEKQDKDIQKYRTLNAQVQTETLQNISSLEEHLNMSNEIRSAMRHIEQEILMLQKKRYISFIILLLYYFTALLLYCSTIFLHLHT